MTNYWECINRRIDLNENPINQQIYLLAKLLKIPTFGNYEAVLRGIDPSATFGQILLEIMKKEYEQQQENQNTRRLKHANFPMTKTLEELDISRYTGQLSPTFFAELSSYQFIKEHKNIVMLGNPGRGKTHLAIDLDLKACALGKTVLFKNAAALSTELTEARDNYVLGKIEKKIRNTDLLILDELGYVSFERHQSELLFKVISDRSERGSTIVTTNLAFSEWTTLFDNDALMAALVDRSTYNSFILDMNGESYRLEMTKQIR